MHVWVERTDQELPTTILRASLIDTTNNELDVLVDEIVFRPFKSVVIAFGGHGNEPLDPGDGAFEIAIDLYKEGYDVHAYDEDELDGGAAGSAPHDEVVNAIENRGVTEVAIYGYSQGPGATYLLADELNNNPPSGSFTIPFTGYIDGIQHPEWPVTQAGDPEDRLPPGTQYHWNVYQINLDILHGTAVTGAAINDNAEVLDDNPDEDIYTGNISHYDIDNNGDVQDHLKDRLRPRVDRW